MEFYINKFYMRLKPTVSSKMKLAVAPAFADHIIRIDLSIDEAPIVIRTRKIGVNTCTTVNVFHDCHGGKVSNTSVVTNFATHVPINEVESVYALIDEQSARARTLLKYIELYALHTFQTSGTLDIMSHAGFNACLATPISESDYVATIQMWCV